MLRSRSVPKLSGRILMDSVSVSSIGRVFIACGCVVAADMTLRTHTLKVSGFARVKPGKNIFFPGFSHCPGKNSFFPGKMQTLPPYTTFMSCSVDSQKLHDMEPHISVCR